MKKIGFLAVVLTAGIYHAQIKFEKGYFIDNSGNKKETLIRNVDWKNNPTDFEYKSDESADIQKENIKNVQEFGINGITKYIRATVMLDRSSGDLNAMSENKAPQFKEETLFLKYIIEGKAALLYYEGGNIRRFFYSQEKSIPQQLIYKPYYIDGASIGYNEDYKKQIAENLKCGIENEQLRRADYVKKDLTNLFIEYNKCIGSHTINYEEQNAKKNLFHLTIRPGLNFSKLTSQYNTGYINGDMKTYFGNQTSFRIGVELEYILPFNKNKWALFTEPTYQYYKKDGESIAYEGTYFEYRYDTSVDYKSIEIPIGARHYFFLNDQSKIFVNAAYVVDFNINSSMKFVNSEIDLRSGRRFVFGAGYKYNDKFSAELRVGTSRNILRGYVYLDSDYKTASLILGYTLF